MLDEPQPTPDSNGMATAGVNAAPTAAKVIARIGPMLGLDPRYDLPAADRLILARGSR
jgi:cell division protein FtsI (penicillin-binding protein 3)